MFNSIVQLLGWLVLVIIISVLELAMIILILIIKGYCKKWMQMWLAHPCCFIELSLLLSFTSIGHEDGDGGGGNWIGDPVLLQAMSLVGPPVIDIILPTEERKKTISIHRKRELQEHII